MKMNPAQLVPSAVCLLMIMTMSVHSQIQECENAIDLEGEVHSTCNQLARYICP